MWRTSVAILALPVFGAQVVMTGSGSRNGVGFRYETRIEPRVAGQDTANFGGGGIQVGDRMFHRYLADREARKYFGYDLEIAREGSGYRVKFAPLSVPAEKLQLRGYTQIPAPRLPGPQVVRREDTIAVELFVHPTTGQTVVDYLTIQDDPAGAIRLPEGEPRDYSVSDAPLTLKRPRISVDGGAAEVWQGGLSGQAIYVFLPGKGRYVFSLAPGSEFGLRRAGEVRGKVLTLEGGVRIECDQAIAPGDGVFHLYVHHDPSWPVRDPNQVQLGASSLKGLLGRGRSNASGVR